MNITTIDFDIIMSPSIETYNHIAGMPWPERLERMPILNSCNADFKTYHKITNYIRNTVPLLDKNNIHFIANHQDVARFVDEPINLINIDHHHDICYNPDDESKLTPGSWVWRIAEEHNLISYKWYHDNNSLFPTERYKSLLSNKENICEANLQQLEAPDKLILCLSPEWVPKQFTPLFYLWMDICNDVHDTFYTIENFSKI